MSLSKILSEAQADAMRLETILADKDAYIETLERKLVAAGGSPPLAPPPPLKVFPDVFSIEWEQWPDEPDTWKRFPDAYQRKLHLGGRKDRPINFMPYRNVIVEKYGALENIVVRRGGGIQAEFEKICNRRSLNAADPANPCWVQAGDDGFETDADDIEFLCRNYQGELNEPLSSWRSDFQRYAQILAEARPDLLLGDWERRRFNLTPGG